MEIGSLLGSVVELALDSGPSCTASPPAIRWSRERYLIVACTVITDVPEVVSGEQIHERKLPTCSDSASPPTTA